MRFWLRWYILIPVVILVMGLTTVLICVGIRHRGWAEFDAALAEAEAVGLRANPEDVVKLLAPVDREKQARWVEFINRLKSMKTIENDYIYDEEESSEPALELPALKHWLRYGKGMPPSATAAILLEAWKPIFEEFRQKLIDDGKVGWNSYDFYWQDRKPLKLGSTVMLERLKLVYAIRELLVSAHDDSGFPELFDGFQAPQGAAMTSFELLMDDAIHDLLISTALLQVYRRENSHMREWLRKHEPRWNLTDQRVIALGDFPAFIAGCKVLRSDFGLALKSGIVMKVSKADSPWTWFGEEAGKWMQNTWHNGQAWLWSGDECADEIREWYIPAYITPDEKGLRFERRDPLLNLAVNFRFVNEMFRDERLRTHISRDLTQVAVLAILEARRTGQLAEETSGTAYWAKDAPSQPFLPWRLHHLTSDVMRIQVIMPASATHPVYASSKRFIDYLTKAATATIDPEHAFKYQVHMGYIDLRWPPPSATLAVSATTAKTKS